MSLSYERLNCALIKDPRLCVQEKRDFGILHGPAQLLYKVWPSSSISSTSISFTCPPPSGNVVMTPRIYFYAPIRLTFTGIPPSGQAMFVQGTDCLRAFPLNGSIDTASASLNGQNCVFNVGDCIHALRWFNDDLFLDNTVMSTTPNYPDQTQKYSDANGTNRSPFGSYTDIPDGCSNPRGGFSNFTIVQNPVGDGTTSMVGIVDFVVIEPIFVSPLVWGKNERCGFFNLNATDFNFTFYNGAGNRMWSHDATTAGFDFTSITFDFGGTINGPLTTFLGGYKLPALLIDYLTPKDLDIMGPQLSVAYPYLEVQRFVSQTSGNIANGTSFQAQSNNLQLNSIPLKMWIFVRPSNNDLLNTSSLTDTFFAITQVSFQYFAENGIMSSSTPAKLYEISVNNGYSGSYTQWTGGPVYKSGVGGGFPSAAPPGSPLANGPNVYTVGSVLCVNTAFDLGLASSLDAPGKLTQNMVQVTIQCTNISGRTINNPAVYVIPQYDGVFTIPSLGDSIRQIGVITSADVLEAQKNPMYNYADVKQVGGGNFLTSVRDYFTHKVLPMARSFVDNHGISTALGLIPHPIAKGLAVGTRLLGYGEGDYGGVRAGEGGFMGDGGVILGAGHTSKGHKMTKKQMADRVRKY